MLFDPVGVGCFIPASKVTGALREALREHHDSVVRAETPLVERIRGQPRLQMAISDSEANPGDRILVKQGLNLVLEPSLVRRARLEQLAADGVILRDEVRFIERCYGQRERAFRDQVQSWKIIDVSPEKAIEDFAEGVGPSGRGLSATLRALHLRAVLAALSTYRNYELVRVRGAAPFAMRCLIKDSASPVVFVEGQHGTHDEWWAEIREPTFCRSLLAHMRGLTTEHSESRSVVQSWLATLTARCDEIGRAE
jgi:hypothetical protein